MLNNYSYGSLASYVSVADLMIPAAWVSVFGRKALLEVEIGFGTGEYLVQLAEQSPARNFLGFEQCAKRIVKTLRKINEADIANVRLVQIDAALAFRYVLKAASVERIHCLFPCPWPKKRHAKHRLFSANFLRLVNSRLTIGGQLRLVTDHRPYVDWIIEGMGEAGFVVNRRTIPATFGTKFEKKWSAAGQQLFDELVFSKVADVGTEDIEASKMRTYFLDHIDPAKVTLPKLSGPVSVQFRDFIFDSARERGMLQAVVAEDGQTQYLWIMVSRTAKNWCLCVAPGLCVLPTEGTLRALELAYEAFLESGKKS